MKLQYKYSKGDVFNTSSALEGQMNIVLYVDDEKMVNLSYKLDDGIVSFIMLRKYDLTDLKEIKELNKSTNEEIPESKWGEIGSLVEYDDKRYILLGTTTKKIGSVILKKPMLFDLKSYVVDNKDLIEEYDNDALELQIFNRSEDADAIKSEVGDILAYTKVPLKKDGDIDLFFIESAKTPKKIASVEFLNFDEEASESSFLKRFKNTYQGVSGYSNTVNIEKGGEGEEEIFSSTIYSVYSDELMDELHPYTIMIASVPTAFSRNKIANFGFRYQRPNANSTIYLDESGFSLHEGLSIFPNQKIFTDSEFPVGTQITKGKTKYAIIQKVAKHHNDVQFKNEEGDMMVGYSWHPQLFVGDAYMYEELDKDMFLLIKMPQYGTKKDSFNKLNQLKMGTNLMLKSRKELKKMDKTPIKEIEIKNNNFWNNYKSSGLIDEVKSKLPSLTYITDAQLDLTEKEGNSKVPKKSPFYASLSSSTSTINPSDFYRYFNIEKLESLKQNEKLYNALTQLVNQSIDTYTRNIETKSKTSTNDITRVVETNVPVYITNTKGGYYRLYVGKMSENGELSEPDSRNNNWESLGFDKGNIINFVGHNLEYDNITFDYAENLNDFEIMPKKIYEWFGKVWDYETNTPHWKNIPKDDYKLEELKIQYKDDWNVFDIESNYYRRITYNTTRDNDYLINFKCELKYTYSPDEFRTTSIYLNGNILKFNLQVIDTEKIDFDECLNDFIEFAKIDIKYYNLYNHLKATQKINDIVKIYIGDKKPNSYNPEALEHDYRIKNILLQLCIVKYPNRNQLVSMVNGFKKDIKESLEKMENYAKQGNIESYNYQKEVRLPFLWYDTDLKRIDNEFEQIQEAINNLDEIPAIKRILDGKTTPYQEWIGLFGGNEVEVEAEVVEEETIEVEGLDLDDLDIESLDLEITSEDLDIDNLEI